MTPLLIPLNPKNLAMNTLFIATMLGLSKGVLWRENEQTVAITTRQGLDRKLEPAQ